MTGVYDIIILDIMLPKLNGIEILKIIRKRKISTPIILLTAKGNIEDKILGLDSGADDYLPKPFSPDELLVRLRALTRRNGDFINENILEFSDIKLNLSTYDMIVDDNSITLTQKEFEILKYFMQRPKLIVSKDDLYSYLISNGPFGTKIAFMERSLYDNMLFQLLKTLIIIGFISLIALLFISIYLTNKSIIPIK